MQNSNVQRDLFSVHKPWIFNLLKTQNKTKKKVILCEFVEFPSAPYLSFLNLIWIMSHLFLHSCYFFHRGQGDAISQERGISF